MRRTRRVLLSSLPVVAAHLFLVAAATLAQLVEVRDLPEPVRTERVVSLGLPRPIPPGAGCRGVRRRRVPAGQPVPPGAVRQPEGQGAAVEPLEPGVPGPDVSAASSVPGSQPDKPENGESGTANLGGIACPMPDPPEERDLGSPATPIAVSGKVVPPKLIQMVEPRYPPVAQRACIQGTTLVEAIIDKNGNVRDCRILLGLGSGLSEAALRAVKQWKFKPATLDGRPVSVYFTVKVVFRVRPTRS